MAGEAGEAGRRTGAARASRGDGVVVVQCTGFGRLDGARFTALPGIAEAQNPGTGIGGTAAW
jgi:hypothetical protein